MNELVKECCEGWHEEKCRLSDDVRGWGCRLMTCLPDAMPKTEHDRKVLFHRVYTYAQENGILECPHYREAVIDEVIDTPSLMAEMVAVEHPSRAVLLSENFRERSNKLISTKL